MFVLSIPSLFVSRKLSNYICNKCTCMYVCMSLPCRVETPRPPFLKHIIFLHLPTTPILLLGTTFLVFFFFLSNRCDSRSSCLQFFLYEIASAGPVFPTPPQQPQRRECRLTVVRHRNRITVRHYLSQLLP